jgi:hypothetical protein
MPPVPPPVPPLPPLALVVVLLEVELARVLDALVADPVVAVVSSSLQPLAAANATANMAVKRLAACVVFTVVLLSETRPV